MIEYWNIMFPSGVVSQASSYNEAKARASDGCRVEHVVMEKEDTLYRTVLEEYFYVSKGVWVRTSKADWDSALKLATERTAELAAGVVKPPTPPLPPPVKAETAAETYVEAVKAAAAPAVKAVPTPTVEAAKAEVVPTPTAEASMAAGLGIVLVLVLLFGGLLR
jgi:hypothetical protein